MGLLDRNRRVLDVVVTSTGRASLCAGTFFPKYVSFTDENVAYLTRSSGSYDAGDGLSFEATNSPHDVVFVVSEPDKSSPKITRGSVLFQKGKAYSTVTNEILTSSTEISDAIDSVATRAGSSLRNLSTLLTVDYDFGDTDFAVQPESVTFQTTDKKPIDKSEVSSLEDAESVYEDKDFSRLQNFAYLPPINKRKKNDVKQTKLGNYPPFYFSTVKTFTEAKRELQPKFTKKFVFDPVPNDSVTSFQVFEKRTDGFTKLDVFKFCSNPDTYYVGKSYKDAAGTLVFVRLFCLIFR